MAILEVQNIRKSFGSTLVLDDISFSMEKGTALSVIGSSGSGKTTLLRCLNFLERPDAGSIRVNGETLLDASSSRASSSAHGTVRIRRTPPSYGKYRFEQNKKVKEAKKNQHVMDVKEIRMSPGIGENDFNTKLKNGQKFLADGDRVKVSVRFRGREMAHTNIGEKLLRDFAEKCADVANLDKEPKLEGRSMSIFLSPKSQNQLKKEQKAKKQAAEQAAAEQDA